MSIESKTKAELEIEIYECVGHASMCWTESPQGVFDEKEATIVSEKLMNTAIEYARSRAIEFAQWERNNYSVSPFDAKRYVKKVIMDEFTQWPLPFDPKTFSLDELYELFSNQTEK